MDPNALIEEITKLKEDSYLINEILKKVNKEDHSDLALLLTLAFTFFNKIDSHMHYVSSDITSISSSLNILSSNIGSLVNTFSSYTVEQTFRDIREYTDEISTNIYNLKEEVRNLRDTIDQQQYNTQPGHVKIVNSLENLESFLHKLKKYE